MGWWGFGPLAGDSPLDTLGFIADELGVECDYESKSIEDFRGYQFSKEILETNLPRLHKLVVKGNNYQDYFYQVVGLLCVYYGVTKIPRALKTQILLDIADDEWAKEEPERQQYMSHLYEAFKNLKKGQRLDMVYEGEDDPRSGTYESILPNSIQIMNGD